MPLVNAHTHMRSSLNSLINLTEIVERCGWEAVCVACTSATRPERTPSNALALLMKARQPDRVYWFPGLHYAMPDAGYTPPSVAEQVDQAIAIGADGFKLIEGKPTARRRSGRPLDDPYYEPLYAESERQGLPVLMHVADPEEMWDREALPEWARKRNVFFGDGTYPTKEALYAEVEGILKRHPQLKLVLAHFYFLSGDRERAVAMLERWPSVSFDLTPGDEMYERFSQAPEAWRGFFERYGHRLLFGTDTSGGSDRPDPDGLARTQAKVAEMRRFLETGDIFAGLGREALHGLALSRATLGAIYAENYYRLTGARPRPLNAIAAMEALETTLERLNGSEALEAPKALIRSVRKEMAAQA
jgi:hypothetical protein